MAPGSPANVRCVMRPVSRFCRYRVRHGGVRARSLVSRTQRAAPSPAEGSRAPRGRGRPGHEAAGRPWAAPAPPSVPRAAEAELDSQPRTAGARRASRRASLPNMAAAGRLGP